jgi:hypothetical protein
MLKRTPALFALLVLAALTPIFLASSCVAAKPVVKTVNDAAALACQAYFGEKQGISFEEAAREFCVTREELAPFLDAILAAGPVAAQRAGVGHDGG